MTPEKIETILIAFDKIALESKSITSWCFTIIGASILTFISTSYSRPNELKYKLAYLLFIPGWILLTLSISFGNEISGNILAANLFPKSEKIMIILSSINENFHCQQTYFKNGLSFFVVWLILFMIWWIFIDKPKS